MAEDTLVERLRKAQRDFDGGVWTGSPSLVSAHGRLLLDAAEALASRDEAIRQLQLLSDYVDNANHPIDYQTRLVALALATREFLRHQSTHQDKDPTHG